MATILVIDDEPAVRDLIQKVLISAGHQVTVAHDGEEGLKQLAKSGVELAIVDLYMAERETMTTLTSLRNRFPELPFIAMSATPFTDEMLKTSSFLGIKATLKKPFSTRQLLKTVEHTLQS